MAVRTQIRISFRWGVRIRGLGNRIAIRPVLVRIRKDIRGFLNSLMKKKTMDS